MIGQVRTDDASLTPRDRDVRLAGALNRFNDDVEMFSIANANTLIAYAKQRQIGLVSFQLSNIFASVNADQSALAARTCGRHRDHRISVATRRWYGGGTTSASCGDDGP
jgi:hypothetical protein